MAQSILIVEDDLTFSTMMKTWLGKKGFLPQTAGSISSARKLLEKEPFDLILSDLRLPDNDGLSLLAWLKSQGLSIPVIIMTGYADIQNAVQAMKEGACDYISKPVQPELLLKKIGEALLPRQDSQREKPSRRNDIITEYIEGKSEVAQRLYSHVSLVAPTQMSVLINGASGSGKEYVAHRIHRQCRRSDNPFFAIDCGSIPSELAASEFFGHVKGSFTGAVTDKTGAFVEANGGTLFLDEVGNLSYEVQVQLLRALQERKVRAVGSSKEIEVDIRLICATNENLQQAIANGAFREDLYHRINEFTLHMPSLADRRDDIMTFAVFFLHQANRELDRKVKGFSPESIAILTSYSWPGNLRQLKNIVKRATLLAQGDCILPADFASELGGVTTPAASLQIPMPSSSLQLYDESEEKQRIIRALQQTNNNKSKAAVLLGVDRKTLYNKIKQHGIV